MTLSVPDLRELPVRNVLGITYAQWLALCEPPDNDTMTHVDDFIDDYQADPYARWMLMHFRLPAHLQLAFRPFTADHKLFCDHRGKRYRCTGASRMGDVWLTGDYDEDVSYELRVGIDTCSNWGAS